MQLATTKLSSWTYCITVFKLSILLFYSLYIFLITFWTKTKNIPNTQSTLSKKKVKLLCIQVLKHFMFLRKCFGPFWYTVPLARIQLLAPIYLLAVSELHDNCFCIQNFHLSSLFILTDTWTDKNISILIHKPATQTNLATTGREDLRTLCDCFC